MVEIKGRTEESFHKSTLIPKGRVCCWEYLGIFWLRTEEPVFNDALRVCHHRMGLDMGVSDCGCIF